MHTVMQVAVAALFATTGFAGEPPTPEEVARKQINRSSYDVPRDGWGDMRLDPLPFTKNLPTGVPNIDTWAGVGYIDTVTLEGAEAGKVAQEAIAAGLCEAASPCTFSFAYTLGVVNDYSRQGERVGIRYVVSRDNRQIAEGVICGTDAKSDYYLREGGAWRSVPIGAERQRMKAAVQAFAAHHKAQVAAAQEQVQRAQGTGQ